MNSWLIIIVALLKSYISPANARKDESSFETIETTGYQCPTQIPDYMGEELCDDTRYDGKICIYPNDSQPYCHLACDITGHWTMICTASDSRVGDNGGPGDNSGPGDSSPDSSNDEYDICECPNKNPLFMNKNSCDSGVWDACKKGCTYSNPLCSYTCDGDEWVEECVEHFDSHTNINCVDGRCSLSDECSIPRAGGYSISGHLSGMAGEYLLTPDGCTGACTGCVLSSSDRTSPVFASYIILYFTLGISVITAVLY